MKARRGMGQSQPGHHHLSSPPFLSSFTSWHEKWHSQPLSLKNPFLSSQTLPVLTKWGIEEREIGGRIKPTEAFFNMAFCQFLCAYQREAVPSCWADGRVVRQGLKFEFGKTGGDKVPNSYSMLLLTSKYSKELTLQAYVMCNVGNKKWQSCQIIRNYVLKPVSSIQTLGQIIL